MLTRLDLELLPDGGLSAALAAVPAGLTASVGKAARCRLQYLDTPDSRLARADAAFAALLAPAPRRLTLQRGDLHLQAPLRGRAPKFASDIEDAALWEALARLIDVRRLDEVIRLDGTIAELQIRDGRDKLVVRGHVYELSAVGHDDVTVRLPSRAELRAVRGYEPRLQDVATAWQALPGIRAATSLYTLALAEFGGPPPFDSGKMDVELRPDWTLQHAGRLLIGRLLATLRANEAGVVAALDTEYLHDFRVAGRRLRALLSQVPGVVEDDARAALREELRWLGSITGPARDADVWTLDLIDWQRRLPPSQHAPMQPLLRLARGQQRRAQRRVAAALGSPRYRDLVAALERVSRPDPQAASDDGVSAGDPNDASAAAVIDVAEARLRRAVRRVRRRAQAAFASNEAADLHRLRLEGKKLRYLLEFFRSLFEARAVRDTIERFKSLQDSLGRIQDGVAQQRLLQESARALSRRQPVPERTLMLMGRLQAMLEKAADEDLARAREHLGEFVESSDDVIERLLGRGTGSAP